MGLASPTGTTPEAEMGKAAAFLKWCGSKKIGITAPKCTIGHMKNTGRRGPRMLAAGVLAQGWLCMCCEAQPMLFCSSKQQQLAPRACS